MGEHQHVPSGWVPTALVVGGGLVLFLVGYSLAVVWGARKGRRWPWWRTGCAVVGSTCGVVAVWPLAAAGRHSFVAHMWAHLLLDMAAPLLLVLAAPVTVWLRGIPAPSARVLSRLLSSSYARFIAHPVVAAGLNLGGLWLLYTTSLHTWMQASPLGHLVVHLHVLLAGWVFTASILQVDPAPHGAGHRLRAVVLVAFLAMHSVLAKHVYANPPAGVPTQQAQVGAQVMYYGGDYIDLALIIAFCLDWYRRTAPRPVAGRARPS